MQSIKILSLLLAFLSWTACKNSDNANSKHSGHTETAAGATDHSGEHTYACPMHPEVTGKAGDTCPKCGMDLEHNDNAGADLPVAMEFRTEPASLEVGKGATLYLTPKRSDDPKAAVPLDVQHGKKIHLIVVSEDLSYFEHIHPEYDASGAYIIKVLPKGQNYSNGPGHNETRFDAGGNYFLFADYKPNGGNHKTDKIPLTVAGTARMPKSYPTEKLSSAAGPFQLALVNDGGKITSGQLLHMKGLVTKGGAAVDPNSLETYLEAKAHVVIINTETKEYLHVHPEVENGALALHTTFDKPGTYRAWIQIKSDGVVHTADYVLKVN